MKRQLRLPVLLGPLLVLSVSYLSWAQLSPPPVVQNDGELVLIPLTPTGVRVLGTVESAVFVSSPFDLDQVLQLESLQVSSGGDVIYQRTLAGQLTGDPRFGQVSALIERLPLEITESRRDRRYFAKEEDPEFRGGEIFDRRAQVVQTWTGLSEEYEAGRGRPFTQIDFPVHTDQIFAEGEAPGTVRTIELALTFVDPGGVRRTSIQSRSITLLEAPLPLPQSIAMQGTSLHAGDLHVHSCHGEAAGACAPSGNCTAESLQLSGSFSYAQLRSQYEALGMDWFTATDHSYCINSSGEFAAIQAECAAATDASFLCLPDIELSSDEVGSQQGSDLGDILCLGTTSANHMGAHDVTSRIPGGGDGLLGFCDGLFGNALSSFTSNIDQVRGMGGYPIVNHPDAGEFGWNSYAATAGIEANAMHGVEIWNGASQSGQGGNVGRWVDWMLDGRLLYAYSGSDTHDEAFLFGANHALLNGEPFTAENLHNALRAGRHYLSNGHALILDAQLGGSVLSMGSMNALPPNSPAASYSPRVHYNFGLDTGSITIFAGKSGDSSEMILCQSGPLSGQGTFTCSASLETSANSWIRAYSESGAKTAYTNPIFFLPTNSDPGAYCSGKLNSNGCVAQIDFNGMASATSAGPFHVTATDVVNQRIGLLFYGYGPAFTPFADGTLCIQGPLKRTTPQSSGGNSSGSDCSGAYDFDFKTYLQSGIDPGLVAGAQVYAQFWYRDPAAASASGLSNALYFSIAP